jgi:hypothetical protein
MEQNLLLVIEGYNQVIASFKNRTDVLNGLALAWTGGNDRALPENTPVGIGDGLGTTGYCVSASECLLNDEIFKMYLEFRKAKAKLISIDIKEQYYGYCYNGSQNKWHTAILVEESGINLIVDVTCRQFGDQFIDKDVWDFPSWELALRSPNCKHAISDRIDYPGGIVPIHKAASRVSDLDRIDLLDAMHDITNIDSDDRQVLSGFLLGKMGVLNARMLVGNITVEDYRYIDNLGKLLQKMPFDTINEGYSVLSFETKAAAKAWLKLFLEGRGKLPTYILVSQSVEASCQLNGYDEWDVNIAYKSAASANRTYLVFRFGELYGIKTAWLRNSKILVPFGIQLPFKPENIMNGGAAIDGNKRADGTLDRETNAIFVTLENKTY